MNCDRHTRFPIILHTMLEDATKFNFEHIVSWVVTANGNYLFKIHNPKLFTVCIMNKYFTKQTKYKSFLRQLNLYGFQRITSSSEGGDCALRGAYFHPHFIRGNLSLCAEMGRPKARKSPNSTFKEDNRFSVGSNYQSTLPPKNFPIGLWSEQEPLLLLEPTHMVSKDVNSPRPQEEDYEDSNSIFEPFVYSSVHQETGSVIPEDMVQDIIAVFGR